MKKQLFNVATALTLLVAVSCDKQDDLKNESATLPVTQSQKQVLCPSNDIFNKRLENNPALQQEVDRIEKFTQKIISGKSLLSKQNADQQITIPIIVHVVYNTDEQNIKWRQVKSQIDELNRGFNKENEDISGVPGFYRNRIADVGIRFELKRITRTKTDVVQFTDDRSTPDFDEKFSIAYKSRGGKNGSDNTKYLNMWVGNFGNGFGGFALNPAVVREFPKSDGVYMDYRYMGSTDVAAEYGSLGRTGIHEVGHWLNLYHLSGQQPNCKSDDGVSDTPRQSTEYLADAPYPESRTCNTPDMTMNFMQSVFDTSLLMFTKGQKERMLATFEPGGIRASFKK